MQLRKHTWKLQGDRVVLRPMTEDDVDIIFAPGIGDHNPRSLKAFQKTGYKIIAKIEEPPGRKARFSYDLAISREEAV